MAKSQDELLYSFDQGQAFESFLDEPGFLCKKMFGGLACYLDGMMVACLVEGTMDETKWKEVDYGMPIWRGILLPTDFEHHEALIKLMPAVIQHPVLKKWLYLSLDVEDYEENLQTWIKCIRRRDPRAGVEPQPRKSRKKR